MKVAVYSTKSYEVETLIELNAALEKPHTLEFLNVPLTTKTAPLSKGYEAASIFVNDATDAEVLEELADCGVKYVALRCAGFNNVDIQAADKFGIKIARVPAYSPDAVAEFAVGMILTVVRKFHKAYNRVREGNFLLDGLLGFNLCGRTVGIIGTGKIGLLTGRILSRGFSCNVIAYDVYHNHPAAQEYGIKYVETMDELLAASDIITLHCPLVQDTYHIIDEKSLAKMKKGVILVNTSRGGLIDTTALIRSLKEGHIGAVALDVYEGESEYFFADSSSKIIYDDNLTRLISFYNVFITGHQAFLTLEAVKNISETTLRNLTDFENGVVNENVVQI